MRMIPSQRLGAWVVLALMTAFATGCWSSTPAPADPDAARAALDRALSAWKDGEAPDTLQDESPSLVVADHHWRGGYQLERFEIDPDDREEGYNRMIRATLWQRGPSGKTLHETVEYAVGIGSPITIQRDDF